MPIIYKQDVDLGNIEYDTGTQKYILHSQLRLANEEINLNCNKSTLVVSFLHLTFHMLIGQIG